MLELFSSYKIYDLITHMIVGWTHTIIECPIAIANLVYCFGWTYVIILTLSCSSLYGITKLKIFLDTLRKEKDEICNKKNNLLSEVFNNIKMLKLYGWQDFFQNRVCKVRDDEINIKVKLATINRIIDSLASIINE